MTFGERVLALRKKNKWSQDDLAKLVGTSAPIIGRYERNEIKPSIETAKNIADALAVTIDYLIGGSDTMMFDKALVQKMEDIQQLDETDKGHLFALMDAFLQKTKMQQIMQ
jgi:transcriptional regulator with XRE-family HTH domain